MTYTRLNKRLWLKKDIHAESRINSKSIAASATCDGFHMIRWRRFCVKKQKQVECYLCFSPDKSFAAHYDKSNRYTYSHKFKQERMRMI